MIVYLAGENAEAWKKRNYFAFNRLASFYYMRDEAAHIHKFPRFMLDSGAFTFMNTQKEKQINWQQYAESYGNFVKQYNVQQYLEIDIDGIAGIAAVEQLRKTIESTAGRQCIPVWHKSRGLDYWKRMTQEYSYVAIGGIVTQEIKRSEYDIFNPLLSIARKNNCKVHALGFTNLRGLTRYKFHSVDSTSWLSGNRFGGVYYFDGTTMQKINKRDGQRVKTNATAIHNFTEWVKFTQYAEQYL